MTETMEGLVVLAPNRLEIQRLPIPEPVAMEVLARVRAVSICGTDAHLIRGDYPGFWPPASRSPPDTSGPVSSSGSGLGLWNLAGR